MRVLAFYQNNGRLAAAIHFMQRISIKNACTQISKISLSLYPPRSPTSNPHSSITQALETQTKQNKNRIKRFMTTERRRKGALKSLKQKSIVHREKTANETISLGQNTL